MAIEVRPTIRIDGQIVSLNAAAITTRPVASTGFSIDWGRADYHDSEAAPSTLTMHLADATGTWADKIRNRAAVGLTVDVSWTGTPSTAEGVPVGPVVLFRGRVQTAEAKPLDMWLDDGRRLWEITLTCADRTADFGNAFLPAHTAEVPRTTAVNHAIRIRDLGLQGGSGIQEVFFWPGYVDAVLGPQDLKDKSALDMLGEFFKSMGNDAWSYDPDQNVIRQAIRLSQPYSMHLGSFDDAYGAVLPVPSDIVVDGVTYPGVALGGRALVGDPQLLADPATEINRLECSWKDFSTGYGDWTTVKESVAAGDSRRVMAWNSLFENGNVIDPTLENVWERVQKEGSRPRHPAISTLPTFEFNTGRMARWLLQAWENTRPAYIAGSLPYQWLLGTDPEYSPVVAPIGGTTTFDALTGWSVEFRVHWIHNTTPITNPATWSAIRQVSISSSTPSVPWWWQALGLPMPDPIPVGQDAPDRFITWGPPAMAAGYKFDESVTWGDLRHVASSGSQITDHLE